jgi:hypothetical protein
MTTPSGKALPSKAASSSAVNKLSRVNARAAPSAIPSMLREIAGVADC